jgi:hypothetical protein
MTRHPHAHRPSRKRHKQNPPKVRFPEEAPMTDLDRILIRQLQEEGTVTSNGERVSMPFIEILTKRLTELALKGGSHAASLLVRQLADAMAKLDHQRTRTTLGYEAWQAEQEALLAKIESGEAKRDRAAEDEPPMAGMSRADIGLQGFITTLSEANRLVPHPDDFRFPTGEFPSIAGPATELDLPSVERLIKWRDAYLWQNYLETRLDYPAPSPAFEHRELALHHGGSAILFMYQIDAELPERLRFRFEDIERFELKAGRLTKRELLKICHRLWKRLHHPLHCRGHVKQRLDRSRDYRTLPFEQGYHLLKSLKQPMEDWTKAITEIDHRAPMDGDYLDLAKQIQATVQHALMASR